MYDNRLLHTLPHAQLRKAGLVDDDATGTSRKLSSKLEEPYRVYSATDEDSESYKMGWSRMSALTTSQSYRPVLLRCSRLQPLMTKPAREPSLPKPPRALGLQCRVRSRWVGQSGRGDVCRRQACRTLPRKYGEARRCLVIGVGLFGKHLRARQNVVTASN